MALMKDMEAPNGVPLAYHRIVRIEHVVNVQTTVEVTSYPSAAAREREKAAYAAGEACDVFTHTWLYTAPYDPVMGVVRAYLWVVGNAAEFDGAESDEDGQGSS